MHHKNDLYYILMLPVKEKTVDSFEMRSASFNELIKSHDRNWINKDTASMVHSSSM